MARLMVLSPFRTTGVAHVGHRYGSKQIEAYSVFRGIERYEYTYT